MKILYLTILPLMVLANTSVLQRYEQRLNSAMNKGTNGRTVKRYKCVEEYVTYDEFGRTVKAEQGTRFTTTSTTTMMPPKINREIRRKPSKKVTIPLSNDAILTTTPIPRPLDQLNEEESDRLIEEMYLRKKESHQTTPSPTTTTIATITTTEAAATVETILPAKKHSYSTDMNSVDSILPPATAPRYYPPNAKKSENYVPYYHPRKSLRVEYDEDYEDFEYFQPYRRPSSRRRPILFNEDFGHSNVKVTRDLSPLKPMKRLRHPSPYRRQYLPKSPPIEPPVFNNQKSARMEISVLERTTVAPLKMMPIERSNHQEMQNANEESCSKIADLATKFGITDVSTWARGNCKLLQLYAPTASCELIYHFIDSCKLKKLF